MAALEYDRGTIIFRGPAKPPGCSWDYEAKAFRAPAFRYREVVEFLRASGVGFEDRAAKFAELSGLRPRIRLRDYQEEALKAWLEAGGRGLIVLPTGAGKTVLALEAVARLRISSLIVVPTIALMGQWRRRVKADLGVEAGALGGGERSISPITVATYDSASLAAEEIGDKFGLLIFDEAHHLPSQSYRRIAEASIAPHRLGLTATPTRADGLHSDLATLIGEKVFELGPRQLAGRHLSEYEIKRVAVKLSPAEAAEYSALMEEYRRCLKLCGISARGPEALRQLIAKAADDPIARRGLAARNRALEIAMGSRSKLDALARILDAHRGEKAIIFTQHNELAYRISEEFLIPAITHELSKAEREEVLEGFRSGKYRAIVASKVLDEGIDVPDASVAVVVSGTGSSREFVQRLGRVLRRAEGKRAALYELVCEGTAEGFISERRRQRTLDSYSI